MNNTKTTQGKAERYTVVRIDDQQGKERLIGGLIKTGDPAFCDINPRGMARRNDAIFAAYGNGRPIGFAGLVYGRDPKLRTDDPLVAADMGVGEFGFTFLQGGDSQTDAYTTLLEARVRDCIFRWL